MAFLGSGIFENFGATSEYWALFGVVCVVYILVKLGHSLWDGVKSYVLARPMGLHVDFRSMGEWAVVTGATDGIGKEYAKQLADMGLNIVLISRSLDKLNAVADEIERKSCVKTKTITIEFTAGFEIYEKVREGLAGLEVGVLVNNVGMGHVLGQNLVDIDVDVLQKVIDVNCQSVVMMSRLVMPQMVARGRGVVINNASGSAVVPNHNHLAYAATKRFMDFFSIAVDVDYKEKGVIVQSLLPFFVSTKMTDVPPGPFIPTAASYVQSALATVGVQSRTFGFPSHALLAYILSRLPDCTIKAIAERRRQQIEKNRTKNKNI